MSNRRLRWGAAVLGSLVAFVALVAARPALADTTWTQVGTGSTGNVSGLAPAASGWVIARDNKLAGQNRIALLDPGYDVTSLSWPGTAPNDLESIAAVPGRTGQYVACTSARVCYHLSISGTSLNVLGSFKLPVGGKQNEAFALAASTGGSFLALWADRGSSTTPGALHAAVLDLDAGTFGKATTAKVHVPWPVTNARQVSDATIVGSRIVIASASDNGNTGPFDSAIYDVGTIGRSGTRATLSMHTPTSLGRFPGHKVEGVACTAGDSTGLLGTDDEKLGGYVAPADVC